MQMHECKYCGDRHYLSDGFKCDDCGIFVCHDCTEECMIDKSRAPDDIYRICIDCEELYRQELRADRALDAQREV